MFRQILTCLAFLTTCTLSSPPTSYLLTFHEAYPPLLYPFTTVSQTCHIRDNECCVPLDFSLHFDPPRPALPNGRRPFFVHHAVITRDPGSNQNSSSLKTTPINPSHNFRVWDYPDEACTGDSVEQLGQPRDRESASTRGHGYDGISAIGLGNVSWAAMSAYQGWDHDFHFPDAIYLDGVRYGFAGPSGEVNHLLFVKDDRTQRPDLPKDFSARPWFNTRWELLKNRNASTRS